MKFLVVRFSWRRRKIHVHVYKTDVHAWEPELEQAKVNGTVLEYVKTKFTKNKIDWQKIVKSYEIQKFSSNRYSRRRCNLEQALDYLKDDAR